MTRDDIIVLLNRLGDPDDAAALAAARALAAAAPDWERLLALPSQDDEDEAADGAGTAGVAAAVPEGPVAEMVEALLRRPGLSAQTREELADIRDRLAAGDSDPLDTRYVKALAQRLGG
ncbi:MAG: hypothetical protein OHK0024_29410 [Thalassobaculales bacterium]